MVQPQPEWQPDRQQSATQIGARLENREPDPASLLVPGIADGVRGMRFITAAVASSQANAAWTTIEA
jgi:hypothetical protein